jgi:hypothetical protein
LIAIRNDNPGGFSFHKVLLAFEKTLAS